MHQEKSYPDRVYGTDIKIELQHDRESLWYNII